MKKCFLPLLFALFLINAKVSAGPVTVADAQQVALNFFKLKTQTSDLRGTPVANLVYSKTDIDNKVVFYVFDMAPAKGFVIVAADDIVRPVLGYSTEGGFNTNFKHIGLSSWISKTSANIHLALRHNVLASPRISGQWAAYRQGQNPVTEKSTAVSPLVTTTWDQENEFTAPPYLYNLMCPWNSTDHQRCVTGCVATAQAQIMKYWNYPAYGMDSFSYNDATANGYSNNYGVLSSNFAAHIYQWSLMPAILTGSESVVADSAVDLLMSDCGVSVAMDYGDDNQGGSGANGILVDELPSDSFCSQYALPKYFSYNPDSIQGFLEAGFTANAWIALIEHELNLGRPVMYEGNDATQGGHAWVCDGYDADSMLHMNWGWSGASDGYFAINNLTTPGFNPVLQDDALVGIVPKYSTPPTADFTASPTSVCNEAVHFTDQSSGLAMRWNWNFGDGTSSKLQNPVHTYADSGTYTVILTSGNPAGFSSKTDTGYITVTCNATGLQTLGSAISFNMQPNPATNDVILQTSIVGPDATWSIKNMLGQTVISRNVEATQTRINLSNLTNGIYLVELTMGENTAVKKLVVSK